MIVLEKHNLLPMLMILASCGSAGCSSSDPKVDIPPLPSEIKLVKPTDGDEFSPRDDVECVMRLSAPPGELVGALVAVGIWKGENNSITKFGQAIEEVSPDGVYELEAKLIAPAKPGRYTVRATAKSVDENKEIVTIRSQDVEIIVQ